jgi:hypothetical protein
MYLRDDEEEEKLIQIDAMMIQSTISESSSEAAISHSLPEHSRLSLVTRESRHIDNFLRKQGASDLQIPGPCQNIAPSLWFKAIRATIMNMLIREPGNRRSPNRRDNLLLQTPNSTRGHQEDQESETPPATILSNVEGRAREAIYRRISRQDIQTRHRDINTGEADLTEAEDLILAIGITLDPRVFLSKSSLQLASQLDAGHEALETAEGKEERLADLRLATSLFCYAEAKLCDCARCRKKLTHKDKDNKTKKRKTRTT